MPDGTETPTGETAAATVNGSPEDKTTSATSNAPKAEEKPDEAAEWRKRAQQAEMRANQLQNEREEAERKRLEEANEFKSLYETEREKNAQREAEEAQRELEKSSRELRDSIIESYQNDVVKEAAKRLTAKNPNALFWSGEADEAQAKQAVQEQLDAIAEAIGTNTATPEDKSSPAISGNNPQEGAAAATETREERIARLEKSLATAVI